MRRRTLILAALAVFAVALVTAPEAPARGWGRPAADPAIAYIDRGDSELYFYRLMVMNADGSNQTEVYRLGDGVGLDDKVATPCWSPDADKIVFVADGDLWTVDIDVIHGRPCGSSPTRLTDGTGGWAAPRWSPDGENIVAQTARNREIALVPADGGTPQTLFKVKSGYLFHPTWSRDGTKVAFLRWTRKATRVKVFKLSTGKVVNTVLLSGDAGSLRWARTETALLFERMGDGSKPSFYTLNLITRTETFLCESPGVNWALPCWSPDDSKVAFGSQESFDSPIGRKLRVYDRDAEEFTTLALNGVEPDWKR